MVRLPGSRVRPEGGGPIRSGEVFPLPPLLRSGLREPAGERDVPGSAQGTGHKGAPRREREHDGALPEKPKGMHWKTYERLWWEHHEAEMEQLTDLREWLDSWRRRWDSSRLSVCSAVLGIAGEYTKAVVTKSTLTRLFRVQPSR